MRRLVAVFGLGLLIVARITSGEDRGQHPIPAENPASELRVALVVGNAKYKVGPLANPVNDATDVAAKLKDLGFKVTVLTDVDRKSFRRAVVDFGDSLEKGGVGAFYYSGHAIQIAGQNYLVPVDIAPSDELEAKDDCVNLATILERMASAQNRVNLVFLDCCRDNPFRSRWRTAERGLAELSAPRGTLICFATGPGSVASDGRPEDRNGLFTASLLARLATPNVHVEAMLRRVARDVEMASEHKQIPWRHSSFTGEFYFRLEESVDPPNQETWQTWPEKGQPWHLASLRMHFRPIAPGNFMMGSPDDEPGRGEDERQHLVSLTAHYWMAECEVTQAQYRALAGKNPAQFGQAGNDAPVESVTWDEARAYCDALTRGERAAGRLPTGYVYRLPTEAEWEYACRAGSRSALYNGNLRVVAPRNAPELALVGWYSGNAEAHYEGARDARSWTGQARSFRRAGPQPVGQLQANAWGLRDMHGNVWEWCLDRYSAYPDSAQRDPHGPPDGDFRVARGGSWYSLATSCRSASRVAFAPMSAFEYLGFRVALAPAME